MLEIHFFSSKSNTESLEVTDFEPLPACLNKVSLSTGKLSQDGRKKTTNKSDSDKIIFLLDQRLSLNKFLNLEFKFTLEIVFGLLILMI